MSKPKLGPLYDAPADHAVLVEVPDRVFLGIDGRGSPHGPAFQGAIRALYAVAYGARALVDAAERHPIGPLEALWSWRGDGNGKEWHWTLLLPIPAAATRDVVQRAIGKAREAHPELALDLVERRHFEEGPCMQILHVGPYRSEGPTLEHLRQDVASAGYEPAGLHHEIYLGDPRRAKPERLRTLLRQPVRRVARRELAA